MNDVRDLDDLDDYEEQIEEMILENGMLTHAVVNVLARKGLISADEIDEEIRRLYAEADEEGDA